MIQLLQSLCAHQAWADRAILNAVREQDGAFANEEIRKLLHHIVVVQRFWLSRFLDRPFELEREMQCPATLEEMEHVFDETHQEALAYINRVTDSDLTRAIDLSRMPEFRPSVRDAFTQVMMHSEHHRAQCAMRLRALGVKPPMTDYIVWIRDVGGVKA